MLIEYDAIISSTAHIPAGTSSLNTLAAIAAAGDGVFRYEIVLIFEFYIGYRHMIGVFRNKVSPRTVNNVQVLWRQTIFGNELIDKLVLFCKTEKAGGRACPGNTAHHMYVVGIGDIPGTVIAEKSRSERGYGDIALVAFRVCPPNVEISLEQVLVVPESEAPFSCVAETNTLRVTAASQSGRQGYRWNILSKFGNTTGDVNMVHVQEICPPSTFISFTL